MIKHITIKSKILFADTDAGGMMYFGNVARFVEDGINSWFKKNSLSFLKRDDLNLFWVVRELKTLYSKTISYDEVLHIDICLEKVMRYTLFFKVLISVDNEKRTESIVRLIPMDKTTKSALPVLSEIYTFFNNEERSENG